MGRWDRRLSALLVLAWLGGLPWIRSWARAPFPGEGALLAGFSFLLLPEGRVQAALRGPRPPRGPAVDRELLRRRLLARLEEELPVGISRLLPLVVQGVEGRGGGGRAARLVLADGIAEDFFRKIQGRPVLFAGSLVGFLEEGPGGDPCVRLGSALDPSGRPYRRFLGIARSEGCGESLQVLLEAARPEEPFPFRVLLANPSTTDTWSEGRYPFVVRSLVSERLDPGLPAGLVLGRIEDLGFREAGVVLRRFVDPPWRPEGLVLVGVPVSEAEAAEGSQAIRSAWDPARIPAAVLWREAVAPPGRILLGGRGLRRGAAVLFEGRCLGVLLAGSGSRGLAGLACEPGLRFPCLLALEGGKEIRPAVLVGEGWGRRGGRFRLEGAPPKKDLRGAVVYSGAGGIGFPPGFRIGRVLEVGGAFVELRLEGADPWPDRVEIVRRGRP